MANMESFRGARFLSGSLVFILLTLLSGCRKKSPGEGLPAVAQKDGATGVSIGAVQKPIEKLAPDDIVVAVDGIALTRKQYDDVLNRMVETYRVSNPMANSFDLRTYRGLKERSLIGEFVVKQILLQEARRRGLKPAPEHLAMVGQMLEQRAKKEGKTAEAFLSSLGSGAEAVRQDVIDQALILTLRQAEFGNRLTVTEADIQTARDNLVRYNRMCEETNTLVMARGVEICKRLRAGEDFAKVADEVTEEKGVRQGNWGEFARGEIEDVRVRNAAFTLPVGAVSDPFDTEEGLVIIKILGFQGGETLAVKQSATVKLGRILLRLGEEKKFPKEAVLRKELERARLAELQRGWLAQLEKKTQIVYPNGTNLWGKVAAEIK